MIKFEADLRTSPARQELPDYSFTANFNSLTAVTTGRANVTYTINDPLFTEYSWKSFGSFIQDSWRVNKRLTLDFGLRWDVNPPPDLNPARRLVFVDFVNPIRLAPEGTKLFPTIWNCFAPRFGSSYQLFDKAGMETVLHGGVGKFYDLASGSAGSVSGAFFPSTASRTSANVQFPFAEGEAFDSSISNIEAGTKRSELGSIRTDLLPKKTRGESVSLRLVMNIGNERPLTGLNQTAGLVNSLMMMEMANRTRQQIKEDLDRLRSTVSVEVGISSANLAITSTRKNLLETLKIANEILKEPLFPQEEFDKAKAQRPAALESQRSEPRAIVLREFRRALSNAKKGEYRYVPTLDEEIAAVDAVTLDAVKKFHKNFFGASIVAILIDRAQITFGNGQTRTIYISRSIGNGGRSGAIQLPSEKRVIKYVQIWCRALGKGRRASLDLYGKGRWYCRL